jgi:hypothetical protein
MLRELLDLELGWKGAPGFALLAAVVWPFLGGNSAISPVWFALLCFPLVVPVGFGRHATLFEAALPIPGRQLVAMRLLGAFALLWLPALTMTGETLVLRGWKDALPLLAMAAALSLAVLVVQSFRIRQASLPDWITCMPLVAVAGLLLVPLIPFSHWGAMLGISFAASAVLLARLWVSVPEGFQIAPAKARRVRRFWWRRPSSRRVWRPVWWPAWSSIFNWQVWVGLLWLPWAAQSGLFLPIGAWLAIPPAAACQRLEWILVLPVSRRRLLLTLVLPWLCILMAVISFARYFGPARKAPMVSTGYSDTWPGEKATGAGTPSVLVPASFWRWAGGAVIPAIESPWGEKTEPRTFHRLKMAFYNPYSVAPNNSARFLDWQFARATRAVYGRSVPLSQAAELQKPGLTPIPRQLRAYFVAALAATLVFLGMLQLAFWRQVNGVGLWLVMLWLGISVPFFIDAFTARQLHESGSLSEVITIQLAAILPQSWPALIVLAALLVGSLYLAAERQFKKMDMIPALRPARSLE